MNQENQENKEVWNNQSLYNYPRPQGNLPMFNFGLKNETKQKFEILYKNVGKYTELGRIF